MAMFMIGRARQVVEVEVQFAGGIVLPYKEGGDVRSNAGTRLYLVVDKDSKEVVEAAFKALWRPTARGDGYWAQAESLVTPKGKPAFRANNRFWVSLEDAEDLGINGTTTASGTETIKL